MPSRRDIILNQCRALRTAVQADISAQTFDADDVHFGPYNDLLRAAQEEYPTDPMLAQMETMPDANLKIWGTPFRPAMVMPGDLPSRTQLGHLNRLIARLELLVETAARPTTALTAPSKPFASTATRDAEDDSGFEYDVAFSFAGTERQVAEAIATAVREAGFKVFYDRFFEAQLWGEDLARYFDKVYRKDARFAVIFVSEEYKNRIWTTHEFRSALARAVQERGRPYILPVEIERVDLEGLPDTVKVISASEYAPAQIADLLIAKLMAEW